MKTLQEAESKYDNIKRDFGEKSPILEQKGVLNFSGKYWPMKKGEIESLKKHDVKYGFEEAKKITLAYIACLAAIRGNNEEHEKRMIKWFGKRTKEQSRDWWSGVRYILGAIETHILKDINVYYRGDRSLIGKPDDYPNPGGDIEEIDVEGYAESGSFVQDNIVGLCEDFFAKRKNGVVQIQLKGRDCVGGVLLHELSHNICGTEDHEVEPGRSAYGERDCKKLALNNPELAWYNADNIEYFIEDVIYNIPV